VSSADEMRAMLDAGASLVQIYSALVYQGPRVVGRLLRA
jgi:dihydroorotate dehydrogenase